MSDKYSIATNTANGSTNTFNIPFSYLSTNYIYIYINEVLYAIGSDTSKVTWLTPSSIQLAKTPANGDKVKIKRITKVDTRLVDYQDNGIITEELLDRDSDQLFHLVQESYDNAQSDVLQDALSTAVNKAREAAASAASAETAKVTVVNSINDAKDYDTRAIASVSAAATSEANALSSKNAAATSASNAASSASAAATSASNAASSATSASNSAATATSKATAASTSASNAATSETNAASSKNAAATSASNAATSATNASASATATANSASAASTSATSAATSENNAKTSETNAASSASGAASSKTNAANSASAASNSASAAATSASSASTSATSASTSATNAASSASNALASKNAAATSAANAATSETNAAASAASAQSAVAGVSLPGGLFKKLKISVTSNSQVSLTADAIELWNSTYNATMRHDINLTINTGSTGANGLDTGSVSANTWYYVWIIYNPTSTIAAGLLSLSSTSPTLPSGYTYYSRFGAVRTNENGYLYRTLQYGANVQYIVDGTILPTSSPTMASGTSGVWGTVSVSSFVPPTANKIKIFIFAPENQSNGGVDLAPNSHWTQYPSICVHGYNATLIEMILESTNVYWFSGYSGNALYCFGWTDNL